MVGRVERILVSSEMLKLSSRGTLKSARIKTLFPLIGMSSMVTFSFCMSFALFARQLSVRHPSGRTAAHHTGGPVTLTNRPATRRAWRTSDPLLRNKFCQIAHSAGIGPLVVIPRHHLYQPCADDLGQRGVDDTGVGITIQID